MMKHRFPSTLDNTLAAAFAAFGVPSMPPPTTLPVSQSPSLPVYATRPWFRSQPTIQPPPPPLRCGWSVELSEEKTRVYIEGVDKKTGLPCLIPSTLLRRRASLTSESGHTYTLTATHREKKDKSIVFGTTAKVLLPADHAMKESLDQKVRLVTDHAPRLPPKKPGGKPQLTPESKEALVILRTAINNLGTRQRADALFADLTQRIGTAPAERILAHLGI